MDENIKTKAENFNDNSTTKTKKSKLKLILIPLIGIVLVIGIFTGINKITTNIQRNKRAQALEEAISTTMNIYGIDEYTVKYNDYSYDVYAEDFESLTKGKALSLLKVLDDISVDDPCGDGKIDFGMTNVHPSLDAEYSYWRVSSYLVEQNKRMHGSYEVPGIYCDLNGIECVYACSN